MAMTQRRRRGPEPVLRHGDRLVEPTTDEVALVVPVPSDDRPGVHEGARAG
jgi:hypothetical protein